MEQIFKYRCSNGDGTYSDMEKLFENHFDVFGLIEKGLAIDLNTIKETE